LSQEKLHIPEFKPMSKFANDIREHKYAHDIEDRKETWGETALRVAKEVLKSVHAPNSLIQSVANAIAAQKFIPGGRYLYATGRPYHQTQNCLLGRPEDSREGWAEWTLNTTLGLSSGAGLGGWYGLIRAKGKPIRRTGGTASGPCSLIKITNEIGREVMQGGSRRSAIWAGLPWWHGDIFEFIHLKDWSPEVRALKAKDYNFPATCDMTNISVCLDDEFFAAYRDESHPKHTLAYNVYWETIKQMLKTGEPGFSVDIGSNSGDNLRNACTEVTSADDSDICNLGSINLAQVQSLDEMKHLVEIAIAFLLAGTVYSDVPYAKVDQIRTKNRRLGLGLMGIHEWLLMHGKKYGPDDELTKYLEIYATSTDIAARYADKWDLSKPVKTRAVAPTGTISIMAETTGGIEPLFCAAYKRRYLKGTSWHYQYVIDPAAKRLVEKGVKPENIEDAYDLAKDWERRVAFQAYVQQYVDHGISSTINLPPWGTEDNNESHVRPFGEMLIKYLPKLRGITTYPDGSRGGQPLNPVKFATAMRHVDKEFQEGGDSDVAFETGNVCSLTGEGVCGS
jgi:ribonucleoside-diphosphate reductase alpha chain